jgi:hypothetical protein
MHAKWLNGPGVLCGAAAVLCVAAALHAEPSAGELKNAKDKQSLDAKSPVADSARVPVAAARDRAKLMHDIYTATLHMMHERYFHGDRATVPARAMQDVFAEIKQQSHTEARWISVNLKPMSIDHEPKSDFEIRAAKELASGKAEWDAVEGGFYRRAGAIQLGGGCISCHAGMFTDTSTAAKFAGLVISVPIITDLRSSK